MSESKHTPGPWNWIDAYGCSEPALVAHGKIVMVAAGCHDGTGAIEASNADKALISAAPDLLSALKDVVKIADRRTDEFDRARAAIAKAEGTTP